MKELVCCVKDWKICFFKIEIVNLVFDWDSDIYFDNSDVSSEGDEVKLNVLEINLVCLGIDWYFDFGVLKYIIGDLF